jgi:hypothetical protein
MLDKEQKRAYQKEYMRQKRSNKKGLTKDENVRPNDQENVRPKELEYNDLMTHLTDPLKRRKLQAICDAFDGSPCGKKIMFGYHGANLDEVRQMLDLTASVV